MAGKKVTPASATPSQSYPGPYWAGGNTGPSLGYPYPLVQTPNGVDYAAQGGMANTPVPGWGYTPDQRAITPMANPAAVRAYTRNAPYMEEFMSDPQTMMQEIMRLRQQLADKPGDPVNEYRLRVLTQALGDVFGMGEKDGRARAPVTPSQP